MWLEVGLTPDSAFLIRDVKHSFQTCFSNTKASTKNQFFCLQTNFNTVLMREKLKKEQIISELNEKLKKVTLQQEKDKSTFLKNTFLPRR